LSEELKEKIEKFNEQSEEEISDYYANVVEEFEDEYGEKSFDETNASRYFINTINECGILSEVTKSMYEAIYLVLFHEHNSCVRGNNIAKRKHIDKQQMLVEEIWKAVKEERKTILRTK
jgi:arginine decarboxylase-like protein